MSLPTKVVIVRDTLPPNPREDTNIGTMVCWHRRRILGDKQGRDHRQVIEDLLGLSSEAPYKADHHLLNMLEAKFVWLPVFAYEHSGITLNTSGFSCPWDSGQVGIIYASREKIAEFFKSKILTRQRREKIKKILRLEVDLYNKWINGDAWGFEIKDEHDNIIDSCYGFIGSDHKKSGLLEYVRSYLPEGSRLRDPKNWIKQD